MPATSFTETPGGVIWEATISLDGYLAGPTGQMDWIFEHIDPDNPGASGVVDRVGAVISGRNSFEVGQSDDRDVYDGAWQGRQFLLTNRPISGEFPPELQIRSGDVRPVVDEALAIADGSAVGIIGGAVARQCLDARLVTEVVVHIAPVFLGGGARFQGGTDRQNLVLIDSSTHGGVQSLHYRVQHR